MANHLPPEIVDECLSHLEDISDWRRAALICRSWLVPSRRFEWSDIHIAGPRIAGLSQVLASASSSIPRCINSLSVADAEGYEHELGRVLGHFESVASLQLSGRASPALRAAASVGRQDLVTHHIGFRKASIASVHDFKGLLAQNPNVQRLTLTGGLEVQNGASPDKAEAPVSLPRLTQLTLLHRYDPSIVKAIAPGRQLQIVIATVNCPEIRDVIDSSSPSLRSVALQNDVRRSADLPLTLLNKAERLVNLSVDLDEYIHQPFGFPRPTTLLRGTMLSAGMLSLVNVRFALPAIVWPNIWVPGEFGFTDQGAVPPRWWRAVDAHFAELASIGSTRVQITVLILVEKKHLELADIGSRLSSLIFERMEETNLPRCHRLGLVRAIEAGTKEIWESAPFGNRLTGAQSGVGDWVTVKTISNSDD